MPKIPNLYVVALTRVTNKFYEVWSNLMCDFDALSDKKDELSWRGTQKLYIENLHDHVKISHD